MPRSLVVDGRDVRNPTLVKKAYVTRFSTPPPTVATSEDADFQDRVEKQVQKCAKNTNYDEGREKFQQELNRNFTEKEVSTTLGKGGGKKAPNDDGILNDMLKRGEGYYCPPWSYS